MPELPEVEVTRRGLLPHLPERRIVRVQWSSSRLRTPIPRRLLKENIQGQQVKTIDRRAKYLLFRMTEGSVLVLHLGMTGKIGLFSKNTPKAKHDHLRLLFENDMELRFNDSRRFGSVTVWPAAEAAESERQFSLAQGIEPFGDSFTADILHRLAATRHQPVKNFLMNSRLIAGVGNIYANETLFAAGIAPGTPVNQISKNGWQAIIENCREILNRAIEAGGSTISDFIGSSGARGYFQLQLNVYDRENIPCPACGKKIHKTIIGGRATYFCPSCQR